MKLLHVAPSSAGLLLFASAAFSLLPSMAAKHPKEKREACQSFTKVFEPKNCPEKAIYVSAKDPKAQFNSIQAAIASLPNDTSAHTIVVGAGHYHEQLNVTRKGGVHILGQTGGSTTNQVTVFFSKGTTQNNTGGVFQSSNFDNAVTAVLSVAPSYNASLTGSGYTGAPLITDPSQFGCFDFRMYNIDLDQRWGLANIGPALAVSISYANASFYDVGAFGRSQFLGPRVCVDSNSGILSFRCPAGYQDTVYAGHNASVLFLNSTIKGCTDILYGFGSLWIENSTLMSRGAGGGITAWKGSRRPANNLYGAYISNSRLTRSSDLNATLDITRKVALGRPWNNASRTVYSNTYMEDHILPAGFVEWSASDPRLGPHLFFAEFNSSGPGFVAPNRAAFPPGTPLTTPVTGPQHLQHLLSAAQASMFSFSKVFGSKLEWVDSFYSHSFAAQVGDRRRHSRSHGHDNQPDTGKMVKRRAVH
ncbi:BQ2448_5238 [Microbotryum intermedium]|uniref:pectinesterase n=1 Tax=Microbotryum intermedium TaxID=269621 RepID=A0A238F3K5_9BASI|nr:BQ2448_5238 [Microbotryum intermedium]